MSETQSSLVFDEQDDDRRVIWVGDVAAATLAELLQARPELKQPTHLAEYCDAVNFLARGADYLPIHDPAAFRARYEQRYQSEDPTAPFQDGAPRLSAFGHAELDELQPPRLDRDKVIFYVEHSYLGIPYRVTAPAPSHPEGEPTYTPLPMTPPPDRTTPPPPSAGAEPVLRE